MDISKIRGFTIEPCEGGVQARSIIAAAKRCGWEANENNYSGERSSVWTKEHCCICFNLNVDQSDGLKTALQIGQYWFMKNIWHDSSSPNESFPHFDLSDGKDIILKVEDILFLIESISSMEIEKKIQYYI